MTNLRLKKFLAALLCAILLAGAAAPAASAMRLETPEGWYPYLYNTQVSLQWIFGFNRMYDALAFLAAADMDTLRCKFTYEGRDWMVQIWKGAYAARYAIGGEIGVYSKRQGWPVEHYGAAPRKDWLGMEMSIYDALDRRLFTRPLESTWWCTGYSLDYNRRPRDCGMVARIQFKDAPMASLFAASLGSKGFSQTKQPPTIKTPETYYVNGDTVHFSWRTASERGR